MYEGELDSTEKTYSRIGNKINNWLINYICTGNQYRTLKVRTVFL